MSKRDLLSVFLCVCLSVIAGISNSAVAQTTAANEWTWMGGSSTIGNDCSQGVFCGQPGVYGTLGTPGNGNVPGSRTNASSWTDSSGNLWLFGGAGFDSKGNDFFLNDVWKFSPASSEWTWMGGSNTTNQSGLYGTLGTPSEGNIPGARDSAMNWTDSSGHFWLFGGWGMDGNGMYSALNDLWEFNPSTNAWTWRGGTSTINQPSINGTLGTAGPGDVPGGLYSGTGWTDSNGRLWLLGGLGYDSKGNLGYPDELWEFDPSANEWTWNAGSSTLGSICINGMLCGGAGVYGTQGAPSPGNLPGSRTGALSWTDGGGNLWLFFGDGYYTNGASGDLNDIWQFNPSTSEWAWMGGSSEYPASGSSPGVYGRLGLASAIGLPGSRDSSSAWGDQNGHFWLFGGEGEDAQGFGGLLNDLWEFNPSTNEWAWVGGSSTVGKTNSNGRPGQPGVYGTLGTPAAGNLPGGRAWASSWTDSNGHFWLFAGEGYDANGNYGSLNDLWEYQPVSAVFPAPDFTVAIDPTSLSVQAGQSGTATITVQDVGGFAGNISFSCSGLPAGVTCSFLPATVTPSGGTAASTTLTVATSATTATLGHSPRPFLPEAALAALLCGFGWKRRRGMQWLMLLAVCFVGLGLLSGCGGSSAGTSTPPPVQPVTSTVTVTATSGALSHTATFALTVN